MNRTKSAIFKAVYIVCALLAFSQTGCRQIGSDKRVASHEQNQSPLQKYFINKKWSYPVSIKCFAPVMIQYFGEDDTVNPETLPAYITTEGKIMDALYNDSLKFKHSLTHILFPDSSYKECAYRLGHASKVLYVDRFGGSKKAPMLYFMVRVDRYFMNKDSNMIKVHSVPPPPPEGCGFADTNMTILFCPMLLYLKLNRAKDSLILAYWDN